MTLTVLFHDTENEGEYYRTLLGVYSTHEQAYLAKCRYRMKGLGDAIGEYPMFVYEEVTLDEDHH